MLIVAAPEFGHPMLFFVLMKADDALFHPLGDATGLSTLRCRLADR